MTGPVVAAGAKAAAAPAAASPEQAKLRKAAQGFEAMFVRQMISSMRTASLGEGLLDSSATEQFRDMSDGKLADSMAQKGALGIGDLLVKQWSARVGGAKTSAPAATAAAPATIASDAAKADK